MATIDQQPCAEDELPVMNEIVCLLAHLGLRRGVPEPVGAEEGKGVSEKGVTGTTVVEMLKACGGQFTLDAMSACPSSEPLRLHSLRTLCVLGMRVLAALKPTLSIGSKPTLSGSMIALKPTPPIDSTEDPSSSISQQQPYCQHCLCPDLCEAIESVWGSKSSESARGSERIPRGATRTAIDGSWRSCDMARTYRIRLSVVNPTSVRVSYKGESHDFPRTRHTTDPSPNPNPNPNPSPNRNRNRTQHTIDVDWSRFSEAPKGFGPVTLEHVPAIARLMQQAANAQV